MSTSSRVVSLCWVLVGLTTWAQPKKAPARDEATLMTACDGGEGAACAELGVLFMGKQDAARAAKYDELGCTKGVLSACSNLSSLVFYGQGGIAADEVRALELARKACDGGFAGGCFNQAFVLAEGSKAVRDEGAAAKTYERACKAGHLGGCRNFGLHLMTGRGVAADEKRGATFYERACTGGDAAGCSNLGYAYENAQGVKKDVARAAKLYERGCIGGDAMGCSNLGRAYVDGVGVAVDVKKGLGLLKDACARGRQSACRAVEQLTAP